MLEKLKKPLFWAGIIGAIKLASDAMGYTFISNDQINTIADGLAGLFTVSGVVISHDASTEN